MGASRIKIIPEIGSTLCWVVDDVYFREVPDVNGDRHVFMHFISPHVTVEEPDD